MPVDLYPLHTVVTCGGGKCAFYPITYGLEAIDHWDLLEIVGSLDWDLCPVVTPIDTSYTLHPF